MARIGASWADGSWNTAAWESTPWKPYVAAIGDAWLHSVWASDTWATTAWFPSTSDSGGQLPRAKMVFRLPDLVVTEVTKDLGDYDGILEGVTFTMAVGGILGVSKTLPIAKFSLSPETLDVQVTGVSISAHTLPVVTFNMLPKIVTPGIVLPPVTFTMSPKAFDTIGLVLRGVLFVMKSIIGPDTTNLNTVPSGLKKEQKKLIRRGKGLFRKSMVIASEDLINEIVDEVDAPDYKKEE